MVLESKLEKISVWDFLHTIVCKKMEESICSGISFTSDEISHCQWMWYPTIVSVVTVSSPSLQSNQLTGDQPAAGGHTPLHGGLSASTGNSTLHWSLLPSTPPYHGHQLTQQQLQPSDLHQTFHFRPFPYTT